MDKCEACKKDIVGPVVKVIDGTISDDGEFEHQNTESYHPTCVIIDW